MTNIEALQPKQLKEDLSKWTMVDPMSIARKLNSRLKTQEIQEAFHEATHAYDCIRRWEVLQHFGYNRYPRKAEPLAGHQFLVPEQIESMDWRWPGPPGRPPLYWRYVVSQSCHWRAKAELKLARALFPDYDWIVVSGERHTAVMCPSERVIFDLTYAAMEVSAQSALTSIFGEDLGNQDYDVHLDDYEYSEVTEKIIDIWELIDSQPEEKRLDLIRGMDDILNDPIVIDEEELSKTETGCPAYC